VGWDQWHWTVQQYFAEQPFSTAFTLLIDCVYCFVVLVITANKNGLDSQSHLANKWFITVESV
jgi:hypothetical protein